MTAEGITIVDGRTTSSVCKGSKADSSHPKSGITAQLENVEVIKPGPSNVRGESDQESDMICNADSRRDLQGTVLAFQHKNLKIWFEGIIKSTNDTTRELVLSDVHFNIDTRNCVILNPLNIVRLSSDLVISKGQVSAIRLVEHSSSLRALLKKEILERKELDCQLPKDNCNEEELEDDDVSSESSDDQPLHEEFQTREKPKVEKKKNAHDDPVPQNSKTHHFKSGSNQRTFSFVLTHSPKESSMKAETERDIKRPYKVPLAMKKKAIRDAPFSFPDYDIPSEVSWYLKTYAITNNQQLNEKEELIVKGINSLLGSGLSPFNYRSRFSLLQYMEEFSQEVILKDLTIFNTYLWKRLSDDYITLRVPGMIDKRPNVILGDRIDVEFPDSTVQSLDVKETFQEIVYFKSKKLEKEYFNTPRANQVLCNVYFNVNRSVLRSLHRSIGVTDEFMIKRLFPQKLDSASAHLSKGIPEDHGLRLFNKSIKSNVEQLQAVWHILQGSSGSLPYILFGPPGTGKTMTVVEAIKQIWKAKPDSRIMVCAPSNAAADVLAIRLVEDIPLEDVGRLLAPSREGEEIDRALDNVAHYWPMKAEKVMKYRVVIVTLASSSRLFKFNIPREHFTHVFIDEAGQATEPETLIALTGKSEFIRIVLSGDPHQLGPVLESRMAEKYGLGKSLLERLMDMPVYQRDTNGNYDPRFITKLLNNFRSHEKLLEVPSKLFYHKELRPCAPQEEVNLSYKLHWIPKSGFPLIFKGVQCPHEKLPKSTSLFNKTELESVITFVKKLLKSNVAPKDIGIVSPYRVQVRLIKERLEKLKTEDIEVGSTEEFQGQERNVIIISTVRSSLNHHHHEKGKGLGFLINKKRFNVAITRAKSLLIIVGDPFLLRRDKNWNEILNFAINNGSYIGVKFH